MKAHLQNIQVFHTDCSSEFNNKIIVDVLRTFSINRSLSMKGCHYDNAVAETTFKIFKTAYIAGRNFACLFHLRRELI